MNRFFGTGLLAVIGSLIMPQNIRQESRQDYIRDRSTAAMEGIVGGAMFAMIATSMLPAAFKGAERNAGLFFVMGFVFSVLVGVLGARFGEVQVRTTCPAPHLPYNPLTLSFYLLQH